MVIISIIGIMLVLIGLWGTLTQKNLIKIVVGFAILDTGVNIIMVSVGFIKVNANHVGEALSKHAVVGGEADPVPSALVLTAIVVGLAVTALMLSYVIKMYREKSSMNIDDYKELRW